MLNVFSLADNDQSVYYLGQLFGNVGIALTGAGPALLGNMFKVFNTVLLAVGAMIVTYTTVVGVFATAQEGEFLGKKWHALWVPLRTLMGIVALFPTKSGYCAIQVVIMWFIVQGVGAADMVWKVAVDYIGKGGAVQTPVPTDVGGLIPKMMTQMFANLVCQSAVVKFKSQDKNAVAHSRPQGNGYTFGRGQTGQEKDPSAECGTLTLTSSDKAVTEAQASAVQTIVPVMEALANQYVNSVIDDPSCWTACDPNPFMLKPCRYFNKYSALIADKKECIVNNAAKAWDNIRSYAGSNFMLDSVKLFNGYANNYAINAALQKQTNISGTDISNLSDANLRKAQANGWIFAGALYYSIASSQKSVGVDYKNFINTIIVKDITTDFTQPYPDFDPRSPFPFYAVQKLYCGPLTSAGSCQPSPAGGALTVAQAAINAMNEAIRQGGGIQADFGSASGCSGFECILYALMGGIPNLLLDAFTSVLTGTNPDPLVSISNFGNILLSAAEVLFWAFFAVGVYLGFTSTPVIVLGTTVNYLSGPSGTIFLFLMPIVLFLLGYLISIGGVLGVYTPLIPYIYFTFGAIGWFLAVIDAMVAAPIVALGILSPGGQHEILGKAEPAVMILLNVFLRPTLMIFGMMIALVLTAIVVKFINAAFFSVVVSITGGHFGFIESFLFVMGYAGLIMTALTKCFSLIYMLPDQLLRWVGGHAEAFGEKAAEAAAGEAKGKIAAGAEAAGAVAKAGVGAGEAISKERYAMKRAEEDQRLG